MWFWRWEVERWVPWGESNKRRYLIATLLSLSAAANAFGELENIPSVITHTCFFAPLPLKHVSTLHFVKLNKLWSEISITCGKSFFWVRAPLAPTELYWIINILETPLTIIDSLLVIRLWSLDLSSVREHTRTESVPKV